MAPGKSSQRLTALLLAGGAFYFWGAWTLHNLLGNETRTNLVNRQQQQNNETSPLLSVQPQKQPVLVPVAKDTLAPHPIAPTPDGAFSACLLVMDDNHYLIEWLAYHYHTLPLRHLIVAVDPRSKTSPTLILDRWKRHGMDIVQWADDDFMPAKERKEAEFHVKRYFGNITAELIQHRARQRLFYFKCMRQHKEQQRDWTLLIDTDEFLYVNRPTVAALNLTAPSIQEEGSVMTFLKEELQRPGNNLTTPCVQMPRIRFGNQESLASEMKGRGNSNSDDDVPVGINASGLQTLRWRHHASPNNYLANRISKTMIDLSRVAWEDLVPVSSIHRPIRAMCGQRRLHIQKHEQVFAINHYLGSWEQYTYRDDSRTGKERSEESFSKSAKWAVETDDDITLWLTGFTKSKGHDNAVELLRGVGELE